MLAGTRMRVLTRDVAADRLAARSRPRRAEVTSESGKSSSVGTFRECGRWRQDPHRGTEAEAARRSERHEPVLPAANPTTSSCRIVGLVDSWNPPGTPFSVSAR